MRRRSKSRSPWWSVGLVLGATVLCDGCAVTTPSTPLAEETLVVLNGGDGTLTLLSLSSPGTERSINLGHLDGTPVALAARGARALVSTGAASSVALVDLSTEGSVLVYYLPAGAGAAGAAFVNDSIAYIANSLNDRATRLNVRSGDTTSVAAGRSPAAVVETRGRVFVANANVEVLCAQPLPCVRGPSWLSVIDPEKNTVIDSIPLPGPGNAMAAVVGADGLIYVMNAGNGTEPGRLSIVDPVLRQEVGNFGGFGVLPRRLAIDGRERLFVTSESEGLMEFNTRTRRVVRGAGGGIPLENAVAAAVDGSAQIYGVESGGCAGGAVGRIRIFRPDLTEARIVPAGLCPTDAVIVNLPPIP